MDKIDKKLVTLLQKNARMPLKSLAEQVFLSSPAVSARIERLEKEGIINGYEAKINRLKVGYHITAFINLEVAPARKPEFYPFVQGCPSVVECNCVTGNYSMLLKVVFPSTEIHHDFLIRPAIHGGSYPYVHGIHPLIPYDIILKCITNSF